MQGQRKGSAPWGGSAAQSCQAGFPAPLQADSTDPRCSPPELTIPGGHTTSLCSSVTAGHRAWLSRASASWTLNSLWEGPQHQQLPQTFHQPLTHQTGTLCAAPAWLVREPLGQTLTCTGQVIHHISPARPEQGAKGWCENAVHPLFDSERKTKSISKAPCFSAKSQHCAAPRWLPGHPMASLM